VAVEVAEETPPAVVAEVAEVEIPPAVVAAEVAAETGPGG
jgi:hypothetical protein